MKNIITILIMTLLLAACSVEQCVKPFVQIDELQASGHDSIDEQLSKVVSISKGIQIPFILETTMKGNALVNFQNLTIRAYDYHGDGELYVGGLASIFFIDLDGDGFKDLVICATKEISDEEDVPLGYRPEFFAYLYSPQSGNFYMAVGIFDPYSYVRNYFNEIDNPNNRIILGEKYRRNLNETSDTVWLDIDKDGIVDKITYSLEKNSTFYTIVKIKLSKLNRILVFSSKK